MVTQLVEEQKKQAAQLEEQEAKRAEEARKQTDLLENLARELQAQQRTIAALEGIVAKITSKPTYSEVASCSQDKAPAVIQTTTARNKRVKRRTMSWKDMV